MAKNQNKPFIFVYQIHKRYTIARRRGVKSGKFFMGYSKDFSKKVVAALSRKGVTIIGAQAVPMFEGDRYYSGTAYVLNAAGRQILRTYSQVCIMASSSWTPQSDTEINPK